MIFILTLLNLVLSTTITINVLTTTNTSNFLRVNVSSPDDNTYILNNKINIPTVQELKEYATYTITPLPSSGWVPVGGECQSTRFTSSIELVPLPNVPIICNIEYIPSANLRITKLGCHESVLTGVSYEFQLRIGASGAFYHAETACCAPASLKSTYPSCGEGAPGQIVATAFMNTSITANVLFTDLVPGQVYSLCEVVQRGWRTTLCGFIPPDGCGCNKTWTHDTLFAVVCTNLVFQSGEYRVESLYGSPASDNYGYCGPPPPPPPPPPISSSSSSSSSSPISSSSSSSSPSSSPSPSSSSSSSPSSSSIISSSSSSSPVGSELERVGTTTTNTSGGKMLVAAFLGGLFAIICLICLWCCLPFLAARRREETQGPSMAKRVEPSFGVIEMPPLPEVVVIGGQGEFEPITFSPVKKKPLLEEKHESDMFGATTDIEKEFYADGPGLQEGKETEPNKFTVHTTDVNGIPYREGGSTVVAKLRPKGAPQDGSEDIMAMVEDLGNGDYEVVYPAAPVLLKDEKSSLFKVRNGQAQKSGIPAGVYQILLEADGKPVKGFPHPVTVKPDIEIDLLAGPKEFKAEGPGLKEAIDSEPNQFTVHSFDGHGQPMKEGGAQLKAKLRPRGGPVDGSKDIEAKVEDLGNGDYRVVYPAVPVELGKGRPTGKKGIPAGDYDILLEAEGEPVKGFPTPVVVKPKPKEFKAEGPGLKEAIDSEPNKFTLHSYDLKGAPLKEGGSEVKARLRPQGAPADGSKDIEAKVQDLGNGDYEVVYPAMPVSLEDGKKNKGKKGIPAGKYDIVLEADGKPVKGFPVPVVVAAKPDNREFKAEGPGLKEAFDAEPNRFTVKTYDKKSGSPLKESGAELVAKLRPKGGPADGSKDIEAKVQDMGNGEYEVMYPAKPVSLQDGSKENKGKMGMPAGDYDILLSADDEPVKTFPRPVTVKKTSKEEEFKVILPEIPAVVSPDEEKVISGDEKIPIKVSARDLIRLNPANVEQKVMVALYEKDPPTGKYRLLDNTEVKTNRADPDFTTPLHVFLNPNNRQEAASRNLRMVVYDVQKPEVEDNDVLGSVDLTLDDLIAGKKKSYPLSNHEKPDVDERLQDKNSRIVLSPDLNVLAASSEPNLCFGEGPGLEVAYDNEPAKFTIFAVGVNGEPQTKGGDNITVRVTPFGSEDPKDEIPAEVKDNGDGTYSVTYGGEGLVPALYTVVAELDGVPIKDFPKTVPCKRYGPIPLLCTASGDGLKNISPLKPSPINIQLKNADGPIKHGGDNVKVEIVGPNGVVLTPPVVDNKNGTYATTYTPPDSGMYSVKIICNDQPIQDSPFVVKATNASPSNSLAQGPGLDPHPKQGEFKIFARDLQNKPVTKGAEPFNVTITHFDGKVGELPAERNKRAIIEEAQKLIRARELAPIVPIMEDSAEGQLKCDHPPPGSAAEAAGICRGDEIVKINGKPVTNPKALAAALRNAKVGDSIPIVFKDPEGNSKQRTLPIQPKDPLAPDYIDLKRIAKGNVLPSDYKIPALAKAVDLLPPSEAEEIKATITDNKDGSYTVKYEPKSSGEHHISVDLLGDPIKCESGPTLIPDAQKSSIEGLAPAVVGKESSFHIKAKTKDGTPCPGAPFNVELHDSRGNEVPFKVEDNGDGDYTVSFTPEEPGELKVDVALSENGVTTPIKGSPGKVNVTGKGKGQEMKLGGLDASFRDNSRPHRHRPSVSGKLIGQEEQKDDKDHHHNVDEPHHSYSATCKFTFTVQAVDEDGVPKTEGGDEFVVKITSSDGAQVKVTTKDNGDGTYKAAYRLKSPGVYTMEIMINGEYILNSPYQQSV